MIPFFHRGPSPFLLVKLLAVLLLLLFIPIIVWAEEGKEVTSMWSDEFFYFCRCGCGDGDYSDTEEWKCPERNQTLEEWRIAQFGYRENMQQCNATMEAAMRAMDEALKDGAVYIRVEDTDLGKQWQAAKACWKQKEP